MTIAIDRLSFPPRLHLFIPASTHPACDQLPHIFHIVIILLRSEHSSCISFPVFYI